MSNRIGRLELLFWFVSSILAGGILLAIVASLTRTAIEFGTHPLSQALCIIAVAVVILRAAVSRFHDIGWSGWAVGGRRSIFTFVGCARAKTAKPLWRAANFSPAVPEAGLKIY
jgi:uncharacterized membrane protein YhaH (DUF805 family)